MLGLAPIAGAPLASMSLLGPRVEVAAVVEGVALGPNLATGRALGDVRVDGEALGAVVTVAEGSAT